jgi:probable rRNA maturation factor
MTATANPSSARGIDVELSSAWDEEEGDRPSWLPDSAQCEGWLNAALGLLEQEQPYSISLRLTTAIESARLNAAYRGKDKPTNVLSFPVIDSQAADAWQPPTSPEDESGNSAFLGDLVLCPEIVEAEATEQGKRLDAHWAHLVIHGLLHLLGYDHVAPLEAQEMESLEIDALNSLGIADPYLLDSSSQR